MSAVFATLAWTGLAIIFGAFGLLMTLQWWRSRDGELLLLPEGLLDTRYLREPVPWEEIEDVEASADDRLVVRFRDNSPNRFRPGVRGWHSASRRTRGRPALIISGQGFDKTTQDLAALVESYWRRHR